MAIVTVGCGSPKPNSLVRVDLPGVHRFGVSTLDGVIVPDQGDLLLDEIPIAYPFKGAAIEDEASVVRRSDDLVLLVPRSAKFNVSELGPDNALPGEPLFVQIVLRPRVEWEPELIRVRLYRGGEFGDLLEVTSFDDPEWLAREFPGAGVYALRKGRYVLVGLIAGTLSSCPDDDASNSVLLPFLGLDAISELIPRERDFLSPHRLEPRPDFEYGVERDGFEPGMENG